MNNNNKFMCVNPRPKSISECCFSKMNRINNCFDCPICDIPTIQDTKEYKIKIELTPEEYNNLMGLINASQKIPFVLINKMLNGIK